MLENIDQKADGKGLSDSPRVLYSFPFRIGAERICRTAWYQAEQVAVAGARVTVLAGSVSRPFSSGVRVLTTLSKGGVRIPRKLIGRQLACRLHDWQTAKWLARNAADIDLVHGWPLASIQTIRVARRLGIPFFLERPNAHTAYAYQAASEENDRLGLSLPAGHDHEFNRKLLDHEEREYAGATFLLCPSEFVARTFLERGFEESRIVRHHYGFDQTCFTPGTPVTSPDKGLVMIYAGVCEPRKGLHYALEAWKKSGVNRTGKFLICGGFVPGYAERLADLLDDPSVEIMGHRSDLPELMRKADLFVLSSVEEGSALVTYEARGSGCVLVVSDASGAICQHELDAMVHPMRDVDALAAHIAQLDTDRALLGRLRENSLANVKGITWQSAGERLRRLYSERTQELTEPRKS